MKPSYQLALVLALTSVAVAGAGCFFRARSPSTQALLREAVVDGRAAVPDYQDYIFDEIARSQAARGYYADALETLQLVKEFPNQLFVKLVSIRAQNGDIAGSKNMLAAGAPDWRPAAEAAIAILQADAGNLGGARETSHDLQDNLKVHVLDEIAGYQTQKGDFDGALATVAGMPPEQRADQLWWIADELTARGQKKRASEITEGLGPNPYPPLRRYASPRHLDPCFAVTQDADAGRFGVAQAILQRSNCDCTSVAYVYEKERNLLGAERALRTCANPSDTSAGMAGLATLSAKWGDIQGALHFAAATEVPKAYNPVGYRAPVLRDIATAWYKQADAIPVLAWARSRPTGYERAMALLGLVDALMPRPDYKQVL